MNAQGADRYWIGSIIQVFYWDGDYTTSEEGEFALLKEFPQAQGDKRGLAGTTAYHLAT